MVPLKKKQMPQNAVISLVEHVSKILLNILTKRIELKIATTDYIGEDQVSVRGEEPEISCQ